MFIFYEKQNLLIGDISTVKIHFISFGWRTFLAINSVIQVNIFEKVIWTILFYPFYRKIWQIIILHNTRIFVQIDTS